MDYETNKVKSFTDLIAWKEAHRLVLLIYKITNKFPIEEQFGLTSQIRRCAVSISSNIAEGFSRRSDQEKMQFYYHSLGSLSELQNQLLISRDIKYIEKGIFTKIAEHSIMVSKLINSLIKFIKNKQ
jgi:four helix bundle protein